MDFNFDMANIILLTPAQLLAVPDGTVLYSIMGEKVIKGKDYIDDDTRGGYLAYGFLKKTK